MSKIGLTLSLTPPLCLTATFDFDPTVNLGLDVDKVAAPPGCRSKVVSSSYVAVMVNGGVKDHVQVKRLNTIDGFLV